MISPFGLTIIKTFERFRARRYLDAVGIPTIGYGHVIRPDETFPGSISEADATILLKQDVFIAEKAVERLVSVRLADDEREALVSWTFNLGEGNLKSSTMRHKLNHGHPDEEIVAEMIRWVHGNGKRLGGLVRRRHCEAIWYMGAPDEIVLALARKVWR